MSLPDADPIIGKAFYSRDPRNAGKRIRVIGYDPDEQSFVIRVMENPQSPAKLGRMTHASKAWIRKYYQPKKVSDLS